MKSIVIDGKGCVLGRLGSYAAKELLKGNSVSIINAESVIVSGKKEIVAEKIKKKRAMGGGGSLKGPKYLRQEDRLLKRMIRGMLPWEKSKGREAFKRLRCYKGNGDYKEESLKDVKKLNHPKPMKYATMTEVVGVLK